MQTVQHRAGGPSGPPEQFRPPIRPPTLTYRRCVQITYPGASRMLSFRFQNGAETMYILQIMSAVPVPVSEGQRFALRWLRSCRGTRRRDGRPPGRTCRARHPGQGCGGGATQMGAERGAEVGAEAPGSPSSSPIIRARAQQPRFPSRSGNAMAHSVQTTSACSPSPSLAAPPRP